jgi:hypothetical protein
MFDFTKAQYTQSAVQRHIFERLVDYGKTGCPLGDFLMAVLCNDWKEAVARADESNLAGMHDLMIFLCNEMPVQCFGSPLKVIQWMEMHGQHDRIPRYVHDLRLRTRS